VSGGPVSPATRDTSAPRGPPHCLRGTNGLQHMARRWSVAHDGVRLERSSGKGAAWPFPTAWGCPQAGQHRRVGRVSDTIGRQQLEGPAGCPLGQEGSDCRCLSVRSLKRGFRALGCRRPAPRPRTGAFHSPTPLRKNSSRWSRTDKRQLRPHRCVEEARVAFQPRAGAASAI